jgi:hypothetical protein
MSGRESSRSADAARDGWESSIGGRSVPHVVISGDHPLSAQIAEAKAAGTALWHRDGEQIAASRAAHEGFFDAVSRLARLPLIPGPGSVLIRSGEDALGASRGEWRKRRRRPRLCRERPTGPSFRINATGSGHRTRPGGHAARARVFREWCDPTGEVRTAVRSCRMAQAILAQCLRPAMTSSRRRTKRARTP